MASREFQSLPFEKAVVIGIYTGQDSLSEIVAQLGVAQISIPIERIPRNSVVARRISRGVDQGGDSYCLCFPFFSSHISMPIKPAEVVWVIFDRDNKTTGYWLSRVHGDETAEDVNYSHFDRAFTDVKETETTSEKVGVSNTKIAADDFPNISLLKIKEGNSYDLILSGASFSYANHSLEPVPRYSKRPGDLVIQGSNNAMVALTTDRGWAPNDDPKESLSSLSSQQPRSYSGTVDIVAGRSRWLSLSESNNRTLPPTRVNRRGFVEVSKRVSDFESSTITEGDPDFLDDAARLYISSNTNVDYNFSLSDQTPSLFSTSKPPDDSSGSSVIAKADEIRLIARTDVDRNVTGSIRIIKEGKKDEDLASILLLPDGTVQISGKEIYLGRSSADGGLSEGDSDAAGSSQPYVRYKQLEDLLKKIISDVKSFCDTVSTHTTPGYGAPSIQINQAASALKSAMQQRENEIPELKSKRIFGE